MNKYKMYFLHDPIGNNERQIINFDKEAIQNAIDQGLIVVGITQDDVREIVKSVDDITEPQITNLQGFKVVLPSYVDSKIDELANVVEKLVDALSISHIKIPIFNDIKESIQKIHDNTLKSLENDKNLIESSNFVTKKEET